MHKLLPSFDGCQSILKRKMRPMSDKVNPFSGQCQKFKNAAKEFLPPYLSPIKNPFKPLLNEVHIHWPTSAPYGHQYIFIVLGPMQLDIFLRDLQDLKLLPPRHLVIELW